MKTDDSKYTLVFDISDKNPRYVKSESTELRIKDGTEFERTYEISSIPTSIFYDVGGDKRYEYVHLSKTEIDGEFALRFEIFTRGDRFAPITVKFKKYEYFELVKSESDNSLIIRCHNRDLMSGIQEYTVNLTYNNALIQPK